MNWLAIAGYLTLFLLLLFLLSSVLFGAPYVPTLAITSSQLFQLVQLPKGSIYYDLGCGDGRMLRYARQHGYLAVGYETNPLLWLWCKWRFRHDHGVQIYFGNFLKADLSRADLVYVFQMGSVVAKLERTALTTMSAGSWLVLQGYRLPKRKPTKVVGSLICYKF